MKWTLKLGRILRSDVYIHFTFLLVLGFIGLAHWTTGRSLEAVGAGLLFFLCLFGWVLLHEYGHALMARRYGIQTCDITPPLSARPAPPLLAPSAILRKSTH